MRTLQTTIKPKRCFAVLATAIILLAATASASAKGKAIPIDPPTTPTTTPPPAPPASPPQGTVRDHRTQPVVRDHRTNVRDHRTQTTPPPVSNGGGVTVTSVPRKSKTTQPGYNPVPGAGPWY